MRRFKLLLLTLFTAVSMSTAVATLPAMAADASKDSACSALNQLDPSQGCSDDEAGGAVGRLVASIVNILSLLVGIAAVIMIIVSGFKYVTAAGDSNAIASAKSTLIYALVGLVIAALAQVIVRFVLSSVL